VSVGGGRGVDPGVLGGEPEWRRCHVVTLDRVADVVCELAVGRFVGPASCEGDHVVE